MKIRWSHFFWNLKDSLWQQIFFFSVLWCGRQHIIITDNLHHTVAGLNNNNIGYLQGWLVFPYFGFVLHLLIYFPYFFLSLSGQPLRSLQRTKSCIALKQYSVFPDNIFNKSPCNFFLIEYFRMDCQKLFWCSFFFNCIFCCCSYPLSYKLLERQMGYSSTGHFHVCKALVYCDDNNHWICGTW